MVIKRSLDWRMRRQRAAMQHPPAITSEFLLKIRASWCQSSTLGLNQLTSGPRYVHFLFLREWGEDIGIWSEQISPRRINTLDSALKSDSHGIGRIKKGVLCLPLGARPTSSWIVLSSKQKHETRSKVPRSWTGWKFQVAWFNWKKKSAPQSKISKKGALVELDERQTCVISDLRKCFLSEILRTLNTNIRSPREPQIGKVSVLSLHTEKSNVLVFFLVGGGGGYFCKWMNWRMFKTTVSH